MTGLNSTTEEDPLPDPASRRRVTPHVETVPPPARGKKDYQDVLLLAAISVSIQRFGDCMTIRALTSFLLVAAVAVPALQGTAVRDLSGFTLATLGSNDVRVITRFTWASASGH